MDFVFVLLQLVIVIVAWLFYGCFYILLYLCVCKVGEDVCRLCLLCNPFLLTKKNDNLHCKCFLISIIIVCTVDKYNERWTLIQLTVIKCYWDNHAVIFKS